MTLTRQSVKNIIRRLIKGQDYRIEIIALINAELRSKNGYKKFAQVLKKLKIPHKSKERNLDKRLDEILDEMFADKTID
jgi:hypothetical protein